MYDVLYCTYIRIHYVVQYCSLYCTVYVGQGLLVGHDQSTVHSIRTLHTTVTWTTFSCPYSMCTQGLVYVQYCTKYHITPQIWDMDHGDSHWWALALPLTVTSQRLRRPTPRVDHQVSCDERETSIIEV